jgi:hypothetical protein
MSIKRFCDCCDMEITEENRPKGIVNNYRLSGTYRRLNSEIKPKLYFEVITGKDAKNTGAACNDGDWCKYCIIEAINALDDRPKASQG